MRRRLAAPAINVARVEEAWSIARVLLDLRLAVRSMQHTRHCSHASLCVSRVMCHPNVVVVGVLERHPIVRQRVPVSRVKCLHVSRVKCMCHASQCLHTQPLLLPLTSSQTSLSTTAPPVCPSCSSSGSASANRAAGARCECIRFRLRFMYGFRAWV